MTVTKVKSHSDRSEANQGICVIYTDELYSPASGPTAELMCLKRTGETSGGQTQTTESQWLAREYHCGGLEDTPVHQVEANANYQEKRDS